MEIKTARLILREFSEQDLMPLVQVESHPAMQRFEHRIVETASALSFIQYAIQKSKETPRTKYRWVVCTPSDPTYQGRLVLSKQNEEIDEWEIGWSIRYQDWGKGYATEAAAAVLNFAFDSLKAHRVVAFCHADNRASSRVMEKLGLTQEGRLRQTRRWKDAWADELVYAILDVDREKP